MRSPFLLLGCALSVAILPSANRATALPVLPSAHILPQHASGSADGQTDAPDDETPEERTARLKAEAKRRQQERAKKALPNEQPETTPDEASDSGDASHSGKTSDGRVRGKSTSGKNGKNGKADTTDSAEEADSEEDMPLRNAPRTTRKFSQPLELFGYSYFAHARESLEARRNALRHYSPNSANASNRESDASETRRDGVKTEGDFRSERGKW